MLNMQDEGPPPPGPAPPVTLLTPPTKPTMLPDWFSADEAFLDLRELEHQNYLSPGSCIVWNILLALYRLETSPYQPPGIGSL